MERRQPDRRYVRLEEITTTGYVANVKNCVNMDIDLNLSPEQEERYQNCIINYYQYSMINPATLDEGPVMQGRTYRVRLKGIATASNKQLGKSSKVKNQMSLAVQAINHIKMLTSGHFICVVSDIEVYNRILVELFDPVTGQSINQLILSKFSEALDEYHIKGQTHRDTNKRWRW